MNPKPPFYLARKLATWFVILSWLALATAVLLLPVGLMTQGGSGAVALLPVIVLALIGVLFGEACCAIFDVANKVLPAR